jgi:hypothetical protein
MDPNLAAPWDDTNLYPIDLSETLRRNLYRQERATVGLSHEVLHAYQADGTLIFRKDGGPKSVALTLQERASAAQSVWTHNHPKVSTFSVDDVERAFECKLAELRAVDTKWVYRLRDPTGWPAQKWAPLLLALGLNAKAARARGVEDIQECNHEGWIAATTSLGMFYTRTKWSPPDAGGCTEFE